MEFQGRNQHGACRSDGAGFLFRLWAGSDDKHIATVDADGVALATIQGLNEKLIEREGEIKHLRPQNQRLEERLERLEKLVEKVNARVDSETRNDGETTLLCRTAPRGGQVFECSVRCRRAFLR